LSKQKVLAFYLRNFTSEIVSVSELSVVRVSSSAQEHTIREANAKKQIILFI